MVPKSDGPGFAVESTPLGRLGASQVTAAKKVKESCGDLQKNVAVNWNANTCSKITKIKLMNVFNYNTI